MGVITDSATIDGPIEKVFDYLADFSTTAEWDPGVVSASRNEQGPLQVGSSFTVNVTFKGNQSTMVYKITEIERPRRIVIKGDSPMVHAIDTMNLSEINNNGKTQTKVDYTADLSLKGWKRPLIFLLQGTFNKLGQSAMEGMESTLNQPGRFD